MGGHKRQRRTDHEIIMYRGCKLPVASVSADEGVDPLRS